MTKPSPQFVIAAAVSILAMGALALNEPTISARGQEAFAVSPAVAGTEMPSLPAVPTFSPR